MLLTDEVSNSDSMVNNGSSVPALRGLTILVGSYVAVVLGTLVLLAVLSATAPDQATSEAWGHGVVVALFAVLLPLRLRSARRGSVGALRATGVVAAVLLLVNVVEASIPDFVPTWMRVQMVLVAALMAGVVVLVARERA